MKKVSLDVWIQLIGMLSVVGSLIFVGLEMRLTQQIAQAGQQQERTATAISQVSSMNEAGVDWQSIAFENNAAYGNRFSLPEIVQRNNIHQVLFMYESDFFQFSQGLMPQDVWDAKLRALTFWYNQCNMREIIESRIVFFAENLAEIIRTLPDECA